MKRVAVFGNAGGGKSAIARRLADLTGLPLYVIDMMQFRAGGVKVPQHEFLQAHTDLVRRDEWIIDGFGSAALSWERFAAADTLVYVDLPLFVHYTWVTKRLIKGLIAPPRKDRPVLFELPPVSSAADAANAAAARLEADARHRGNAVAARAR